MRKSIFYFSLFIAILACNRQREVSSQKFEKPAEEKLDSVGTWLINYDNYLKDNYLSIFENNFKKQIEQNKLDSAARLLDIAGSNACRNFEFDSVLIRTTLDFLNQYETTILPRFRSGLYNNLGNAYAINLDYDKSISYFNKNSFRPENYYSAVNIARAHEGKMFAFVSTAKHDSAIHYGQKTFEFYKKDNNPKGQARILSNIAYIFFNLEDYKMAEKYYNNAIAIAQKNELWGMKFSALADKAIMMEETKDIRFFSCVDSLTQLEQIWKPQNIKQNFWLKTFQAMAHIKKGNNEEANSILKQIEPLYPQIGDEYISDYFIKAKSLLEIAMQKPISNEHFYLERINKLKNSKAYYELGSAYSILYQNANIKKNHEAALTYYQNYTKISDSTRNNAVRYEVRELEKKYLTAQKEEQLKRQGADLFQKNAIIILLSIGLILLLYFYNTLKKKNSIIAQQNELNEHTITILSHDIKEPLLGVKLMLKKLNKDDPFVAQASQSLANQINSVNDILNNLLKMKKISMTQKDKNATANVKSVVQNVIQELSEAIQNKELIINNEISDSLNIPIAPEKLQIIVNNLLSNAVKYSFPNQSIRIFQEGNGFCIQDFGVGLSPEQRSKVMREVTASQQGTSQERGNGLGLFLVGALLQGEQIKVLFDSPKIGGTIVKVLG
jgi:signal transduction histidine kinase